MSARGVAYCDDCGWQACLRAGGCLEAEAEALDVAPSDLELDLLRPARVVAGPSAEELDALASALNSHKLSTGEVVIPPCDKIGAPPASMPAGTGLYAPPLPCSGRSPLVSRDGDS